MPYDNGNDLSPDALRKPALYLSCKKNKIKFEKIACNLNRSNQADETIFRCRGFEAE